MLALTATVLLLLLPAQANDDVMPEDKAKLQGTWTIRQAETKGQVISADLDDQVLVFEGDKYFVRAGDRIAEEGTFTIRPDESPRQIDLKILKGQDAGRLQLGLYKFEGDDLRIVFARPGDKVRPARFQTEGEGAAVGMALYRKKTD